MAKLYEIDAEILACLDEETGEIVDPEKLNALMMQREHKIESVALWVKNLLSDAEAYKAEKEAFAEREKAAKNKAESLKNWLSFVLDGQKFESSRVSVTFRKSEAVQIDDENKIPREFIREKIESSPDKTLIKKVIKAGDKVEGCSIVLNNNIQIK